MTSRRRYWRNCEDCGVRAYCREDDHGLMCCGKCFAHDEPSMPTERRKDESLLIVPAE